MKKQPGVNFWTKERVELPPFNIHMFHRVDFRSDDVIIGFMEFGDRSPETLTADDVGFLTSYFFPPNSFEGTAFSYDIVGRDAVQTALPGMRDTFLRIRKSKAKAEHSGKVTVCEVCAECGFENSFLIDCAKEGYKTKCAECGADLMLCDECRRTPDGESVDLCDFRWIDRESGIGTCFRRGCRYYELDLAALWEAEAMDAACAVRMDAGERAAFEAWDSTRPPVGELDPTARCGPFCKHLEQGAGGPGEYVYRCAAPGNEHVIHVDPE